MQVFAFIMVAMVATLVLPGAASAVPCEVHPFEFAFEGDTEAEMIVRSGTDCAVKVPTPATFRIDGNGITEPPRHGGARTQGAASAYYRSNPGYRGRDSFTFTLCGIDGERSGCSNIRVRVIVR